MVLYVTVCVIIAAVTRGLAYWGIYFLKKGEIPLINGVLHLSYVENTGAAFGIFQDSKIFLPVVSIVLFLALTYYAASRRKTLSTDLIIALAMIAGGGISNVADRFIFGFVVDYVYLKFINFPVFNFADTCVVLGTLYVAFKLLREK
jgi:signal peptidase II